MRQEAVLLRLPLPQEFQSVPVRKMVALDSPCSSNEPFAPEHQRDAVDLVSGSA
jgi:hypothetical protein